MADGFSASTRKPSRSATWRILMRPITPSLLPIVFGSVTSSVSALVVTNINVVTKWDFNGSFNITTPGPSYGSGTALLIGGVTGASAGGSTNDTANALS